MMYDGPISIEDEVSEEEYYDRCKKFKSAMKLSTAPYGLKLHLLQKVAKKLPENLKKEFLDE
tara:strand:- start:5756 stop:5941 length:186 start_codon:yes stop_codon:yes gene_type:complete